METIINYMTEIVIFVTGLFSGFGLTIAVQNLNISLFNSGNIVQNTDNRRGSIVQNNNNCKGDIVAGDKYE